MTRHLNSMVSSLAPLSTSSESPGQSQNRSQSQWTKLPQSESSGSCTPLCTAALSSGIRSSRCWGTRSLSIRSLLLPLASTPTQSLWVGVLRDKDLFSVFADPNMLDTLIPSHPALVNAIILVLHSVASSTPLPTAETSSRSVPSSSYRDMPGGFLFEGLSDDEDDFHQSTRTTPSSSTSGSRPASLGYTGAAGPRPITQSELATALALASTPESSSHTPTPGTQGHSSGTSPMSSSVQSGTPITNDLFSQALQHALQASGQPNLQSQWQLQLQQLRDMGIHDDELSLRALQATGGDIQAALELIFAGGAP
nr:ubiquitin-like protein 7 isoform X1 [Zootoca vivipara]